MVDTKLFYNYLINKGIDFFAGVPDSLLSDLCSCIKENSDENSNIITANEGNAVAMCAGRYLSTGKIGAVYMQNSGEGNTVNPILSLVDDDVYSIPVLLIMGWRGEPGKHDEPQHVKQGKVMCSLLEAMQIEYCIADNNFEEQIDFAFTYMLEHKKPYAIIIKKGYFTKYEFKPEPSTYKLSREDVLNIIIGSIGDDIVVSTTGKTSREIFEIREQNHQGHSNDFLTVGSMGHTASIAYGVALGTDKNVWCVDGDGSFLMHMGSLAVIGSNLPSNFKYILNDNRAHESVGGQPTCSGKLDIVKILTGCGFKQVIVAENSDEILKAIELMKTKSSIALVMRTRQGARDNLGRPTVSPIENKNAFMKKLGHNRG